MDKNTWIKCFALLKSVYGKVDDNTEKVYLSILINIPNNIFENGVKVLISNYEYDKFPKPATILKYCGMDENSMAQKAITVLKKAIKMVGPYRSVDLKDRSLHALVEKYGGWESICLWTEKDFNIKEKMLIDGYIATKNSGILGSEYLQGISERENIFNGYKKFIKLPKLLKIEQGNIKFIESNKIYGIKYNKKKQLENKDLESIKQIKEIKW